MLNAKQIYNFTRKVKWQGTCLVWTAEIGRGGYGVFRVGYKSKRAHRAWFEHMVEPVPDGYELDHKCRVRHCVNPNHLRVITHAENMAYAISAIKTHCVQGHPLSGDSLYVVKGTIQRKCKACRRNGRGITKGGYQWVRYEVKY